MFILVSANDFIATSMKIKLRQLNFDPHQFYDHQHVAMVMFVGNLFATWSINDCLVGPQKVNLKWSGHITVQRARIMFWGTPYLPSHPLNQYFTPRKCYKLFYSQVIFQAALKPFSLNPNDSVSAVTLENEALPSTLFIVFAAIVGCIFTRYVSNSQQLYLL